MMVSKVITAVLAGLACSAAGHADEYSFDTKQFAGWTQEELNEKWGMDVSSSFNIDNFAVLIRPSGASRAFQHLHISIMSDVSNIQK